ADLHLESSAGFLFLLGVANALDWFEVAASFPEGWLSGGCRGVSWSRTSELGSRAGFDCSLCRSAKCRATADYARRERDHAREAFLCAQPWADSKGRRRELQAAYRRI